MKILEAYKNGKKSADIQLKLGYLNTSLYKDICDTLKKESDEILTRKKEYNKLELAVFDFAHHNYFSSISGLLRL